MERAQSLGLTSGLNLENRIANQQELKPDVKSILFTGSQKPEGNLIPSIGDESPKARQAFQSVHGKPSDTPSIEDLVSNGFSESAHKFTLEEQKKFPAETRLLNQFRVIFNLPEERRDTLLQKQLQNSEGDNLLKYPELLIGIGHHLFLNFNIILV